MASKKKWEKMKSWETVLNVHNQISTQFLNRLLGAVVTIGMFIPLPLMATTYTVTTPNDPAVNPDGTIAGGGTSLRSAILKANSSGAPGGTVGAGNIINFDPIVFGTPQTITLGTELPLIFSNVNIQGPNAGVTVDGTGAGVRRGVFISALPNPAGGNPNGPTQPISVTLSNMILQNMRAKGGNGTSSGGGGMGAGGALFVNSNATVTLVNTSFANNQAVGGNGAVSGGGPLDGRGGGGGLGGNGGDIPVGSLNTFPGAGGGIGGNGNAGGGGIGGNGGNSIQAGFFAGTAAGGGGFGGNGIGQILQTQGFAIAGASSDGSAGGLNGGGGGANTNPGAPGDGTGDGGTSTPNLGTGGGGGSGGGNGTLTNAGNGGIGGGGGASGVAGNGNGGFGGGGGRGVGGFGGGGVGDFAGVFSGTAGGFGGGGGGGVYVSPFIFASGGAGGFGAAGGGPFGQGGFGGGNGSVNSNGSGGGAAMGGSIFVVAGGTLQIQGNSSLSGSALTGGTGSGGGTNGSTFGTGIFLQGNGGTLTFNPVLGTTQTYSNQIADQTGVGGVGPNAGSWSLTKSGAGTLVLSSDNLYSGGTLLNGGDLSVNANTQLGTAAGSLTFNGGTLKITGTAFTNTPRTIVWHGGGFNIADDTNTFTIAQNLTTPGALTKTGPGTLVLSGANTYTGGTTISAGTLRGNTTSLQGNILDNAALVFDQAANGTFGGNISGTGSLTKLNGGNLTLTGTNTYSGGTTITGGDTHREYKQPSRKYP